MGSQADTGPLPPTFVVYRHRYGTSTGHTLTLESSTDGFRIEGMKFGAAEHTEIAKFTLDESTVRRINEYWARYVTDRTNAGHSQNIQP